MNFVKKELLFFNVGMFVFSFIALYFINQLPVAKNTVGLGAGFFPSLIIWFILIINFLLVINCFLLLRSKAEVEDEEDTEKQSLLRFFGIVGLLVLYVWSWELIDYKITTFLFLLIGMKMLYISDWKKLIIIPLGIVILIYLFFEVLLRIPMP